MVHENQDRPRLRGPWESLAPSFLLGTSLLRLLEAQKSALLQLCGHHAKGQSHPSLGLPESNSQPIKQQPYPNSGKHPQQSREGKGRKARRGSPLFCLCGPRGFFFMGRTVHQPISFFFIDAKSSYETYYLEVLQEACELGDELERAPEYYPQKGVWRGLSMWLCDRRPV